MTPDELRIAIETLWPGHGGQTRAARHFSIGDRRVREYLSGARAVPEWMSREVRDLLKLFPAGVREVDPDKAVSMLQESMEKAGWAPAEGAAAILAVAIRNAYRHVDRDQVRGWLLDQV